MTQLSDADREFAVKLIVAREGSSYPVSYAEHDVEDYPADAAALVATARALRDAEREPEITALRAENARLRARAEAAEIGMDRMAYVLRRWQSGGCPDCHGDCASANPPVALCIMQATHAALAAAATRDVDRAALGGENG